LQARNLHQLDAFQLMTVRTRPHRLRTRPRLGRRVASAGGSTDVAAQTVPQARERDAGGPEDRAAYRCSCGFLFEAPVSTTVGCPHCGGTQAW
jgi:hypothetical protein